MFVVLRSDVEQPQSNFLSVMHLAARQFQLRRLLAVNLNVNHAADGSNLPHTLHTQTAATPQTFYAKAKIAECSLALLSRPKECAWKIRFVAK